MIQEIAPILKQIREDKDIFQKSRLIQYLLKEKKLRIIDLAQKIGYQSSYICHLIRLRNIPEVLIDGYYSKSVSSSHLFIISRLKDKKQMIELYEKILSNNSTVKETEAAVRNYLYQVKSVGKYLDDEYQRKASAKIAEKFPEAKIQVVQTRIKGKISIEIKGDLESTSKSMKALLDKLSG